MESETVECSTCLAEPATAADGSLELDGWDMDGEFGPVCPECWVANRPAPPTAGLNAIAQTLDAKKEEP